MIDLRSDTLTLPNQEMLQSVLSAKMGDDGRIDSSGRGEDETVNMLENMAAELTGKKAALLFCSGTLGNTTALMTYCGPGDQVMVDTQQHIYRTEKAAFSERAGQMIPVLYHLDEHGPNLLDLEKRMEKGGIKLLCIENTHNSFGGACIPLERLKQIRDIADCYGVPIHMDGARLFNATTSLGVPVEDICQYVDSVMFCISKGLGAPIGSLVCSTEDFILKAKNTRKLLGGNMRQAGIIAAPGIYALTHNIQRLKEDHKNAKLLSESLADLVKTKVQQNVESNIVMINTENTGLSAEEYCGRILELGLKIRPTSVENQVRLVFYKGITRENTLETIEIIRKLDTLL